MNMKQFAWILRQVLVAGLLIEVLGTESAAQGIRASNYTGLYRILTIDVDGNDGSNRTYSPPSADNRDAFVIRIVEQTVGNNKRYNGNYRFSGQLGQGNSFVADVEIVPSKDGEPDYLRVVGDIFVTDYQKPIPNEVKEFEFKVLEIIPNATSIMADLDTLVIEGVRGRVATKFENYDPAADIPSFATGIQDIVSKTTFLLLTGLVALATFS